MRNREKLYNKKIEVVKKLTLFFTFVADRAYGNNSYVQYCDGTILLFT